MKNEFTIQDNVVTMDVQGRQVKFDIADIPLVENYRWKSPTKCSINTGYRDSGGVGRTLTLHKLLTGSRYVQWLNGDVYDYRRSNIVPVSKRILHRERGGYLKGNEHRIKKGTVIILIKSKGQIFKAYVDQEDYPLIAKHTWCRNVQTGYAQATDRISRKGIYMHRLILDSCGFYVKTDHINGDRLDNRRHNLRKCDDSQNHHNNILHRAGVIGVSRHAGGGWDARLQVKTVIHRKYFKTYEEALKQRRTWEKELNPSGLEERDQDVPKA